MIHIVSALQGHQHSVRYVIKPPAILHVMAAGIDHQPIRVQLPVIQSISVFDHGLNPIVNV
jgi:hypothetical protein